MKQLTCNFCKTPLEHVFVDLGMAPMVSAYLKKEDLSKTEVFYPLRAYVCNQCYLVQLPEAESPNAIFRDYPYFSSCSESWLQHAKTYVDKMEGRLALGSKSLVVEIASNDGYLLQYFKEKGVPVQGVEPANNIAKVAQDKGIPTFSKFFGVAVAEELVAAGKQADLLIGNNVLAHVPDINDFVGGLKLVLKSHGTITMEFPHLLQTMLGNQFDQVFHEHFSYLSLIAVRSIFSKHGLTLFDVEELQSHGGSLRIYAKHAEDSTKQEKASVAWLIEKEHKAGLDSLEGYSNFSKQAQSAKHKLLKSLIDIKGRGCSIVGYGAPGKGCILLNYAGIRTDFLDYIVDINPEKQNRYMPGVRIPILHPDKISETKPQYVLILPWNLKKEIMEQLACIRDWEGKFLVPIPEVRIYS